MTDAVIGQRESLPKKWLYVLATTNPPKGTLDPVSKWLWITRAGVLPMTLVAAGLGGLLAVYRDANVDWGLFALAAVGIVLAHMANNIMNDLFDLEVGTDTADYPRNLYSPHPVISGVVSRRPPRGLRARRQRDVPRDHAVPHRRAGLADRRVRARRLLPLGRVHRAAAPVEEARTRRADGRRGVGTADGRRRLLRGHRVDPRRGDPREPAVRDPLHDGAHGQAHRQGTVGRSGRHAHAARSSSATARPAR